jgi:hypothetical protein
MGSIEGGMIGFFSLTKYPPSPVFQLFGLGIVLLVLGIFRSVGSPPFFMTFGRATLFFYISHLYLLAALSFAFPQGAPWLQVFVMLGGVLVVLYVGCRRWKRYKNFRPANHWVHYL